MERERIDTTHGTPDYGVQMYVTGQFLRDLTTLLDLCEVGSMGLDRADGREERLELRSIDT